MGGRKVMEREEEGNLMKCYSMLCYVNMKRERGEQTQHPPTGEREEKRPNRNKVRQRAKQKHNERFRERKQAASYCNNKR